MKVTLVSHTQNARELLVFTKSTRLNVTTGLLDVINLYSPEKMQKELDYMVDTIKSSWEFVDFTFCIEGVISLFAIVLGAMLSRLCAFWTWATLVI